MKDSRFIPESPHIKTILIVDDEPGIISLCQRLLEKAGFHTQGITEPTLCAEILEKEQIDLLLVDIRMPTMDGFQLIDISRRLRPDLAVVVMTGFGTVDAAVETLRKGADGLILKPFTGAELVQSVQRALQEKQHKQDLLRLQTLKPLFAVTTTLFEETDPKRLQELLLDSVCGHLRCSDAGLYQQKENESSFWMSASRGGVLPAEINPRENLPSGKEFSSDLPLKVDRENREPEWAVVLLQDCGLGSLLIARSSTTRSSKDGESLLIAARGTEDSPFHESDLEMFAILSRQAAIALENARLQAELRAYIHQVQESQRALVKAEKMAIAGRLTASIAHEINNPLQSVQNCLHLAARTELPLEERQNYLSLAQTELERLMNTVQRMLDYYRPAAIDKKLIDVNQSLQRVLSLMEHQLYNNHVHLKSTFSQRLPRVMGVDDQIQQVFLNIVLNAIEAMPEGGELTVKTQTGKHGIEVTFEDTGPGIPVDRREQIFEPFVSTKEGGTGLGLAVSYGIIAAHGGSLDLISGSSQGACFRISLPVGEST